MDSSYRDLSQAPSTIASNSRPSESVDGSGDDIYMFIRQYEFQNPPTATTIDIVQPYVWGCRPPITIDDMIALNPLSITEPPQSQWHSHLQSKGDPDRATNGPAFVVRHPKGQNGDTIVQAMAAVRRAIAHGSEPSADDLVRFLQHEASSYTCLCLDEGPCGKKFERRHRAVDHVRGHFGLRAYPCRGGCGKVRCFKSFYTQNDRQSHENPKIIECDACGKTVTFRNRIRHWNSQRCREAST